MVTPVDAWPRHVHIIQFDINVLLESDDTKVEIEGSIDFVTANKGGHGFYRTRYSDEMFDGLLEISVLGESRCLERPEAA